MPAFLLFLLFLGLKLVHVIDWSWWWVTSPLWILGILVVLYVVVWGGFAACIGSKFDA